MATAGRAALMPDWVWLTAGILVAAAEVLAPGVYLLWIGIAAVAVGLALLLGAALSLTHQLLLFAALAVALALLGQLLYVRWRGGEAAPGLNRRAEQLIGSEAALDEPIENGVGRIRLGDTVWRVRGPDLPAGEKVHVVAVEGTLLKVRHAAK
jgi:membrane protein implicated in regulation of membrane protease activity